MSDDPIKTKVREQFGRAAANYSTSEVHARGESLDVLAELIPKMPDGEGLDIAAGAGHTAIRLAPLVRRMIASDWTPAMLEEASRLARERGVVIETCLADVEHLPFANDQFDLVTCRLAFHHFPDPAQATSEMARVLKPGGWLGFADNFIVPGVEAELAYNRFEKLRDPSHVRVQTIEELRRRWHEVGIDIVAERSLEKEFEFHSWADRQHVAPATKKELLRMLEQLPAAARDHLRPRWEGATAYFTLSEVVLVGRKQPDGSDER